MQKERFLEGNRQKWVGIGLVLTLLCLVCNILFKIDPSPYLQAIMLLIGAGVLGWSVDSAVKAYRVNSTTHTETYSEDSKQDITVTRTPKSEHYDDGTIY